MRPLFILLMLLFPHLLMAESLGDDLHIQKIAGNLYLHTSFKTLADYGRVASNGLVVIDNDDAYLIDTPWQDKDTEKLIHWIEQSGYRLKASIATHFHDDRSSGIGLLNQLGIKTYASALTNQLLAEQNRERAKHSFNGNEFWLLADKIYLYYPGKGHTQDNLVVWITDNNLLFGGCLVRSMEADNMGNTADASMSDWAATVKNVMDKFPAAKVVIPGHGAAGTAEMLSHTLDILESVPVAM
ncbi:subclass B1 metallo-beta-lactamase [Neptunicella sp. SCSIO 80796]|uniref:subclass B1 metallo-beta-lactamase n=1 Tax=Neptunicella plasticusilytica TaxID=3117012 RepID=UPI003A4D764A